MSEILVFCERDEVAAELLSKGKEFKERLSLRLAAAILGEDAGEKVEDYFAYGADRVYLGRDPLLKSFYPDVYAEALYQISQNYGSEILLIGSTKRGKELAPRVAQKLGAGCVTDAIDIRAKDGNLLVDRYALGGNTVASELIKTGKKVISVMPRSFKLGEREKGEGEIVELDLKLKEPKAKIIETREKAAESVDLEGADIIVSVGRGLARQEDLELIRRLARALNAEMGCTKSLATEYQWLSEERIIGLSGKKCKPSLCLSIGISGQIQHAVGIRGSKIIAAINKDRNAPIFTITDYGIVGDLYEIVPKLLERTAG